MNTVVVVADKFIFQGQRSSSVEQMMINMVDKRYTPYIIIMWRRWRQTVSLSGSN